jgi:hypothetical protein
METKNSEIVFAKSTKRAPKVKSEKRNMIQLIDWNEDENLFGDVVLVKPELKELSEPKGNKKTKVKYSVPPGINERFLGAVEFLVQMTPYIENIGLTETEYKKYVLTHLAKFIDTRVRPIEQKKQPGESKLSSFQIPRKASDEYAKLYRKLKEEGNDMSSISYKDNHVSMLDSAKTVRMYITTHDLKDADTKHIVLDDFTKNIFKDHINELYKTNGGEFINQRQIQALGSYLIKKLK